MADHKVVVTRDERGLALLARYRPVTKQDRHDYYDWSVICSDPGECSGWIECHEPHDVNGRSAADGPYETDEGDPWDGQDEFMFHGVLHEWKSGFGWTVPYEGCPVAASATELPDGIDTSFDGEYAVDAEWDDDCCWLTLTGAGESRG